MAGLWLQAAVRLPWLWRRDPSHGPVTWSEVSLFTLYFYYTKTKQTLNWFKPDAVFCVSRTLITGMASGSIVAFNIDFNRWHFEHQNRYWERSANQPRMVTCHYRKWCSNRKHVEWKKLKKSQQFKRSQLLEQMYTCLKHAQERLRDDYFKMNRESTDGGQHFFFFFINSLIILSKCHLSQ